MGAPRRHRAAARQVIVTLVALCAWGGAIVVGAGSSPATPPPHRDDVRLALPAAEAGERDALLALVRRARDEIAAATGLTAPDLRVTVHATVESFGRATGQTLYVAGATRGTRIDLMPFSVLRRGGQLERVVRHEVAHTVVDRELADRALWVREGAASYFTALTESSSSPGHGDTGPVPCPADFELRQPASGDALRNAYARAETCFRRVLANGIAWRNVR